VKYKLAIFDFDGTLADSFPWLARILNDVAETFRFRPVEETEFESLRRMTVQEILVHLNIPRWKVAPIAWHVRALMARDIEHVRPFVGVDGMLKKLAARGMALAIASSNTENNVRQVLGMASASIIDYYACGASIFAKATKITAILRRSDLPAKEVIYIGDEVRDVEAARHAGIAFGGVTWGYTRADTLLKLSPTLMFMNIDDVIAKLG
jgi:phosphoglycolate phosphatase